MAVDNKDQKRSLGGDMSWKKAVFLGGAVLLLAACNSATAPNASVRGGGGAAKDLEVVPLEEVPIEVLPVDETEACRGYYVRSGRIGAFSITEAVEGAACEGEIVPLP
jgi:hypothetical protein